MFPSLFISAAAIPAHLNRLSAAGLESLTPEVLLAISQTNHRHEFEKVFQQALSFKQMLRDAIVVQTYNFEMLKDTEWSLQNVKQCRQLLLTVLEPLPEGLPDDPPTQVETTTKTTLP
jgi:hypothetical protein